MTPWTAACQASLSITNSWSLLKLMSIESVMPFSHLIPCCPLLLLSSIFPSIKVFSSESVLHIRWPKYWNVNLRFSPSNEYSGLIFFRMDCLDLLAVQGTLKSLLQHHSSKASILQCPALLTVQLSYPYMTTGETIALTRQKCLCFLICCLLLHSKASPKVTCKVSNLLFLVILSFSRVILLLFMVFPGNHSHACIPQGLDFFMAWLLSSKGAKLSLVPSQTQTGTANDVISTAFCWAKKVARLAQDSREGETVSISQYESSTRIDYGREAVFKGLHSYTQETTSVC